MNSHLPKLMFSSIYLLNKDSLRPWNRNEVYNFEQTLAWCVVSSYNPQETILPLLNILESLSSITTCACICMCEDWIISYPLIFAPFLFFHYITEETRSESVLRRVWLGDSARDPQLNTPQILKTNKQIKIKSQPFSFWRGKIITSEPLLLANRRIGQEIPLASHSTLVTRMSL